MRGRQSQLVLATVAALVAAGCVTLAGPSGAGAPADWAARALPAGGSHDHKDWRQHLGLSTPNFLELGWDPLLTDYYGAGTPGALFCGSVADAGARKIAYVASFASDVAFVAADVTDPAHPFKVGELALPFVHVYDLAVTPDGRHVILGTDNTMSTPDGGIAPKGEGKGEGEDDGKDEGLGKGEGTGAIWRDACGRESPVRVAPAAGLPSDAPYYSGVVLVDVSNPAAPVISGYFPLPVYGAHSVFATAIDGETRVLASVANGEHVASYYVVFDVLDTPTGGALAPKLAYRPPPANTQEAAAPNGHEDGFIAKHPITGQTLLYFADWMGGVSIVDVSNGVPVPLGKWNDWPANPSGGMIHGVWPLAETWNGRHYTLAGQELGGHPVQTPTGVISILDTTDPAHPTRVGAWTLPVDVHWSTSLEFSTHYFTVVGRTLFASMYHGGLWAVSLADPAHPRSVGVWDPDHASPKLHATSWRDAPFVLDPEPLPNGNLAVWDGPSGVYTLHFDESDPAPAVSEWPLSP